MTTETLTALLSLSIVGAAVSLGYEWIKSKFSSTTNLPSRTIIVVASIVVGTGYYFISKYPGILQSILAVLSASQVVYAIFIAKDPSTPTKEPVQPASDSGSGQ